MANNIARRRLLGSAGLATLAVYSSACDLLSTSPGSGDNRSAGKTKNPKEAPTLTKKVKAGDLPPLADRLPKNPMVVHSNSKIGTYGGELSVGLAESVPLAAQRMYFVAGYENLLSWNVPFKGVVPNLASSYRVNGDGTVWTFKLRPGIKWSDGTPFTADDVVFAVTDFMMNKELNPEPPSWLGPATARSVDKYTVELKLPTPNGILPYQIATQSGSTLTSHPQHYMKKFHKKYNPDVDALAKKAGVDNWIDLYMNHVSFSDGAQSHQAPTLTAWVMTTALASSQRIVVDRNPYYWKVDSGGSQLPYVERIVFERTNDQVELLKISNGDSDFTLAPQEPADKPVLARSRDKGKYEFHTEQTEYMNEVVLHLNLTHRDPVKRKIFNNKDFRIALSHAINRPEVISAVYQRQGEPWQIAPRKESAYFDEKMAKQYTEYDVAKANSYLDKAYPDKNAAGIRLGPDRKPIMFNCNVATDYKTFVDTTQLLAKYWREVGIGVSVNNISRELLISTAEANKQDATVWFGEGGLDGVLMLNPFNYLPTLFPWSFYGVLWGQWYLSGGKAGEKPPADVARQLELYDQMKASVDEQERKSLLKEVLAIARDRFHVFGVSLPAQSYRTVTDRTQNWPKYTYQGDWVYSSPGPANPSQFFVTET